MTGGSATNGAAMHLTESRQGKGAPERALFSYEVEGSDGEKANERGVGEYDSDD